MRLAIPPSTLATSHAMPLMIAAFCLLWSSAFAVAKLALAGCPPLLLLTARFLLAGGLMLTVAAVDGAPWRLSRRDILVLAVLGVANNALYLGLNYFGMRSISAGLSALIISANPVLTVVLAAVFLNERMTWRKTAGLLLGIGGVAFIVQGRISGRIDDTVGVAFTVAALVSLVAELAPARRARLLGASRFGVRLPALVPPSDGQWGNDSERLSLSDAAARDGVRVAPSWRARCMVRPHRGDTGRTRHLPGYSHGEATARAREADAGFAARAGRRQEDVMRASKTSQSRLNTIEANQPVAIAIIAVARP
jgi:uncharacterized membrane protein